MKIRLPQKYMVNGVIIILLFLWANEGIFDSTNSVPVYNNEAAIIKQTDNQWLIYNGKVGRVVRNESGKLKTIKLVNGLIGNSEIVDSEEFCIVNNGRRLNNNNFQVSSALVKEDKSGITNLIFDLYPTQNTGIKKIQVIYRSIPDKAYMYKLIRVYGNLDISEISIEKFHSQMVGSGGGQGACLGQPVFLNGIWFIGLEHPAGVNIFEAGNTTIKQILSNQNKNSQFVQTCSSVLGTGLNGQIKDGFNDYLNQIRCSKPRPYVLYNTWFDLGENMDNKAVSERIKSFQQNLRVTPLSAFVLDNGWQNPNSIYDINYDKFPDGFKDINSELRKSKTVLGLWMPLSGARALNTEWGEPMGYKVSSKQYAGVSYYCLNDDKYYEAIKKKIQYYIEKMNVRYFKLDWNIIINDPQSGAPQDQINSLIRLLLEMKRISPDVFISLTSFYPFPEPLPNTAWLSPWWLMYVDTVWSGGYDTGYVNSYQLSLRDQAITYRDGIIYSDFSKKGISFPINSIMTHGFVDGTLNRIGGNNESDNNWTKGIIMEFGRGTQMQELYITPGLLTSSKWSILNKWIIWWQSNFPILITSKMIGGDPVKGEIYGYCSFINGKGGFLVIRNPSSKTKVINIIFNSNIGYNDEEADYSLSEIYPCSKELLITVTKGVNLSFVLNGGEVKLIQIKPAKQSA